MTLGNILLLLAFQLAGEFLHRVMHVPLSGPLLGMALLLLALVLRGGPSPSLQGTTRPLLASLALLFVPAGVGVIGHLDLLAQHWPAVLAATLGGAVASLLATAGTMLLVERLTRPSREGDGLTTGEGAPGLPAPAQASDGARP